MENITRLYQVVHKELMALVSQEKGLQLKRQQNGAAAQQARSAVRQQYATQRSRLQEDLRRAESYVTNTIALMGGTRPNAAPQTPDFNRMRQLFVSIDEPGDPAVGQLLKLAAGSVAYLQGQLQKLDALENNAVQAAVDGGDAIRQEELQVAQKYQALLGGKLMQRLANAVKDQAQAYFVDKSAVYDLQVPDSTSPMLKFGVVQKPFPVPDSLEPKVQALFGVYYDPTSKTLRLPFGCRTDRAVKIMIRSPESMKARLQSALRGVVFNILRHYEPMAGRVVFIDPATYNPEHLGMMKHFAGADRLIDFPTGDEEACRALSRLMNSDAESIRYLIVRGYPGNLSGKARDRIRNICNNAVQYGVTVILTGAPEDRSSTDSQDQSAMSDALRIHAAEDRFRMTQEGETYIFGFFTEPRAMTPDMNRRFTDAYVPKLLGCKYPDRVDLSVLPQRTKGSRKITVPYGVDEHDRLCQLDFSNTNFAMYMMGAAGSGKSTLLHTIITGLIRNYHPDDVELWLADFKMGEFSQYIDPLPPHVKYILLDESPELVYDFVELLTQEMMRRKHFFSIHPELKKVEALSGKYHMPTIFVIIDEFALMSQAVYESEHHKKLLTNLLIEGRALGFKFIFASQEYTKGIRGLSGEAKDQVQTRIAMKNTVDEIRQTLELPGSTVTDKIRRWIDTLPPHVALYKHYDGAKGENVLSRAQVLYFAEGYGPQKAMVQKLKRQMRPVSPAQYDPADLTTWVDKQPVIADGTSYRAFSAKTLAKTVEQFRREHPEDVFPEDVFLSLGEPRRLISGQLLQLMDESRENMLLLTGNETAGAVSLIRSAGEAFVQQGGAVQIWAYKRNRLAKSLGADCTGNFRVLRTPEEVAGAMSSLKEKVKSGTAGRELIVLLGMDRLLEEMENRDMEAVSAAAAALQGLGVSNEQEKAAYQRMLQLRQALDEELDRIEEEGEAAGKSEEEILREQDAAVKRHMGIAAAAAPVPPTPAPAPAKPKERLNPTEDLRYLVTRGSTVGYHFLLCAEDVAKMRQNRLNPDLFRHRLAFCISQEDSSMLFGNRRASKLPQRICLYDSETTEYTFRPYLHQGTVWDGWDVDEQGHAIRRKEG